MDVYVSCSLMRRNHHWNLEREMTLRERKRKISKIE